MKKEKKKCICLARVSTKQQELESQTKKIIEAAHYDGYDDERIIIIENKESAVKNDEASLLGITEMKSYIEEGCVDCVYCFEISRLSRRPKDLYSIRDYLMEHKVQLVVLTPPFRLLDAEGNLDGTASVVFALYSSFAEQEGLLRRQRCVRGKLKKKEEGKFVGGKLLMGYGRDSENRFIIDREGAALVHRIFHMYDKGKSKLSIAEELYAEGYFQNFENARYAHTHIDNVLHNADYTGLNGKPQIVSVELFERVQKRLNKPQTARKKIKRLALAQGMMFNPESKNTKKKFYVDTRQGNYYCYIDREEKHKKFIRIGAFDTILWDAIKSEYDKVKASRQEMRIRKQQHKSLERKIVKLVRDIEACDEKVQRLEERYVYGKLNKKRLDEMERKIENDKREMLMNIELLSQQQDAIVDARALTRSLDELSDDEKQEIAGRLVDHIDLTPVGKQWFCRWKYEIYFKNGEVYSGDINQRRSV